MSVLASPRRKPGGNLKHLASECPRFLSRCTPARKWISSTGKGDPRNRSIKQWAAVTTTFGAIKVPVQLPRTRYPPILTCPIALQGDPRLRYWLSVIFPDYAGGGSAERWWHTKRQTNRQAYAGACNEQDRNLSWHGRPRQKTPH